MRYWYFLFEGRLNQPPQQKKLFASVLLPVAKEQDAVQALIENLAQQNIELVNIEDDFAFYEYQYDRDDPDNAVWFNWLAEVKKQNQAVFTPWQFFD
ncbi:MULTISPECIES: hypothetical protein [unclassified Acinetobacter]|uniref:hypothetical protein n=1 Tax=unclassified Acinetobacter TaxID=196816 RepID=UPI0035B8DE76